MLSKLPVLVFLLAFISGTVVADEDYEFHRIVCDADIPAVEIRRVTFYNISNVVWPEGGSTAKEASLRKLSNPSGLYALDFGVNPSAPKSIKRSCGPYRISFFYEKVEWSKGEYRLEPRVSISANGRKLFSNINTGFVVSLRTYLDGQGRNYFEVCHKAFCDEAPQVGTDGPIGNEDINRRYLELEEQFKSRPIQR